MSVFLCFFIIYLIRLLNFSRKLPPFMKCFLTTILFCISINFYAQEEVYAEKVENFIILQQLDSAKHYLSKLDTNKYPLLHKIINKDHLTYTEYYKFTTKLAQSTTLKYTVISDYIDKNIKKPANTSKINKEYFNIKWSQVSRIRDDGNLSEASKKQTELEKYVFQFNEKDPNFLWAKTKLNTYAAVMFLIEKEIEDGVKLVEESIDIAQKLNDTELEIIFLNHLTDFYVEQGKLKEFIDTCETILILEEQLPEKSLYYYSTISHLIDAYIYKGGNNKRVLTLIDELYNSHQRNHTYAYYGQLIAKLDLNSALVKSIFQKFDVDTILALTKKFEELGKDLNSNDFISLIYMNAKTLQAHEFYKEAYYYKDLENRLVKRVYSEDLSESLASYKTAQAIKEKEKEITLQEDKILVTTVLALMFFVLLVLLLAILLKISMQSKVLANKKVLLEKALSEKELLMKEVHHRVKNNFQLIHSLLELQADEIQDAKVIELLQNGRNRVRSMALIHQKLYKSEAGLINFTEYLTLLVNELSLIYNLKDNVEITTSSKVIMFDVDTAIPLALIVNEIITNSYKHAFTQEKENKLYISLKELEKGVFELIIKDNGTGISEGFDIKNSTTLGLRLISRLIKQLHGELQCINENGAKFIIIFKDSNLRQQVL